MNLKLTTYLLIYCIASSASKSAKSQEKNSAEQHFKVEYQWSFINYTWESPEVYQNAIDTQRYIPQNIAMAGIKFYKDKVYIAIPRICPGSPVTLGYIDNNNETSSTNRLISPFPDWHANDLTNHTCDKLENVQSMEIDADGIMWVLDGSRASPDSQCPAKLVLYDLNNNSNIVQTYTFPDQVCLSKGGGLNDIVIDDTDGGFAYITDTNGIDPGLIVYSKAQNRAWKLRDPSMFAELDASGYVVDNFTVSRLTQIDGIALSPKGGSGPRYVYYCALTGLSLYSISTDILKNKSLIAGGNWRFNVTYIGRKQAQSDGMVADNEGNLYYGLLPLYGVGRWNSQEPFSTIEIVDTNKSTMIWTDSFGFDDEGYLHLLANRIHTFFGSSCEFDLTEDVKFRILKYFTGTNSYLY